MPWDAFKQGDQWCVYKLDADNGPSGSALGCHDSEGDAHRQLRALYASEAQKGYVAPRPVSIFSRVKTGITMYKGSDGLRYMLIVTSNSYKDRDAETIRTKALAEYVDKAWAVEGMCLPDNELLFWHDGDPIGDIIWTDMEGPFLYEVAKERPNKRIQLSSERKVISTIKNIWNFIESNPQRYRWGASHGFKYLDSAKKNGVYDRIAKFETSTLPLDAAANPYTFAGVVNDMNRDKVLDQIVKIPGLAAQFRKGIRQVKTELDKQGLEHKAVKQGTATKGMLDDMRTIISDALSQIGDVPDGMVDTVLQQIVASASAGAAAAVEPDGDEMGVAYDEVGTDPVTDTGEDAMNGKSLAAKEAAQVKLLDRLITSQGAMAEAQIELTETSETILKGLASVTEALKPVAKVVTTVDDLSARIKTLEDRLKGAPRRAALAEETVIDSPKITAHAEKMLDTTEELFPGSGVKIRSGEPNGNR